MQRFESCCISFGQGRQIRQAFVPQDGFVFLASDYSQIELRVLAHISGDPGLIAAFRAGEDIHRHTAARAEHCTQMRGGVPVPVPLIEIVPPREPAAAARARLASIGQYDLVIFVSRNAVDRGLAMLREIPAATPQRANNGINSLFPPDAVPKPPGCWTLWLTSKTTG